MRYLAIEFTSTKIYINVERVKGKNIFLEKEFQIDIPVDVMINGVISEYSSLPTLLANELKKNKVNCRKVFVTIDNPDCKTEDLSVLRTSPKNLDNVITQELSKRKKISSDTLYAYKVLGDDKEREGFLRVKVIYSPKAIVESIYMTLKKAGLSPFRLSTSSYVLELFAHDIGLPNSDSVSILICMTDSGVHFYYSGKNVEPLYSYLPVKQDVFIAEDYVIDDDAAKEKGNELDARNVNRQAVINIITENVAKYRRFHAQRNRDGISGVYLYGEATDEELSHIIGEVEEAAECNAGVIDIFDFDTIKGNGEVSCYMYNTIIATREFLISPKSSINLFDSYIKRKNGGRHAAKAIKSAITLFIFCTAIILGYYGYKRYQIASINKKIAECETYINDESNQALYAEASKTNDEYLKYMNYNDKCGKYIDSLTLRKKFTSEIMNRISEIAGESIVVNSYSLTDTTLKMKCLCSGKDDPAKFSELLTNSGRFLDVKYSGFKQDSSNTYGQYSFDIDITLWNERRE